MDEHLRHLEQLDFAWVRAGVERGEAFEVARGLIGARCAADDMKVLELVGEFVVPPLGGRESRGFQTLHLDFGLPLDPKVEQDVARYTALYIPKCFEDVSALTRLVPLRRLLRQRSWPSASELLARLIAYGKTHGAWDDDRGYVEGSLARIVEAAAGASALPSVKNDPGFLCGMEFDSLTSEARFFDHHSLYVEEVETEVALSPGELLVFDNLALAHGRRGIRRPGELHQWVFGERRAGLARQRQLRDGVLAAFDAPPVCDPEPVAAPASVP